MPSLIHYEGWDSVSAPSIPAGWTVGAQLTTTSSPTGGINPLSNPNVLAGQPSVPGPIEAATYDTPDSASGNVLVYASFNIAATGTTQVWGVFARSSAYPVVVTSSNFYWATLSPTASTCELYAVVGGTATPIGSVSVALSSDTWYQLQLSCQGSTISVTVVNGSNGYFLDASGNFISTATAAIAVTNTSVTGSGYAGLTLQDKGASGNDIYSDEWYFFGYGASAQGGPVRALPIVQRARGRGRVIQPLAVRFGTPALPLSPFSFGIIRRDPSRPIATINHGRVWLQAPPPVGVPAPIPFAFWKTIRWVDPSETRRRAAPGKASTPTSFARPPVPPVVAAANWRTIRALDTSELRRRIAPGRVWLPAPSVVPGGQVYEGWTQQYITSVSAPLQWGTEVFLSWTSDIPAGANLVYQVYENDALVWHGTSPYCTLPVPAYTVRFDIGTVGFTQQGVSFASLLPPAPLLQAELSWLGGTFEASDIAGFHVYGENSPSAGINYSSVLASIPAYTAGIITDGFGYGNFGFGGFGNASGSYNWTSGALTSGRWNFAVTPFDSNGNEGTAATTSVTIVAPPGEPAPFANRSRLIYKYNQSLYEVTLNWNASPG